MNNFRSVTSSHRKLVNSNPLAREGKPVFGLEHATSGSMSLISHADRKRPWTDNPSALLSGMIQERTLRSNGNSEMSSQDYGHNIACDGILRFRLGIHLSPDVGIITLVQGGPPFQSSRDPKSI